MVNINDINSRYYQLMISKIAKGITLFKVMSIKLSLSEIVHYAYTVG